MEKYFCKAAKIDPNTIGISSGTAGNMENCSFLLANKGDVFVLPAPSYPYYMKDLGCKGGLERFSLQTHHDIQELKGEAPDITEKILDNTLQEITS